ncbi:hypothetical protein PCIT_b0956 [Pseudoalteromonas citrea]|uniref:Uncharacterized protein n=2 Tax=Pseudoalteromonas citrea TaxID=43655 RepID=A0AAD4FQ80_9GAMM|nr:hypothetical protein [Pseudoalteromonas citrea]KAF7764865.1 hypothetical protein PCIT_b0956 [Pseudoalteromonas citrea]
MNEQKSVENAINAFYKVAGLNIKFNGSINNKVAEIFGKMIIETQKCTTALNWVPRPTGGKATISWVAKNFTRSVLRQLEEGQSLICAKTAVLRFKSPLHLAAMGV